MSNQYINIDPKNNNYKYQVFEYNCGHVYRYFIIDKKINRDEFIYIHIQKRIMKQENNMSDRFLLLMMVLKIISIIILRQGI